MTKHVYEVRLTVCDAYGTEVTVEQEMYGNPFDAYKRACVYVTESLNKISSRLSANGQYGMSWLNDANREAVKQHTNRRAFVRKHLVR